MIKRFWYLLSFFIMVPMLTHAATIKSGYAPVNGLKIYFEIRGPENSKQPPLVLLHGGGSTIGTSFGKAIDSFAKSRQVIAFEQQGHGHTADIDRPFSFEQSADDAAALLSYLHIQRADFFGYSNGGSIAMQIAIRHPNMVNKLIVASAMIKRDGFYPQFWEGMQHASLESMPTELKEAYLKTSPHPDRLQSFHDKSVARMLNFKDWPTGMVQSIQAPTLIINGDRDVIRPEHAMEMFRILPHARLAILPADHMTLVDQWPVAMIENFLDTPQ